MSDMQHWSWYVMSVLQKTLHSSSNTILQLVRFSAEQMLFSKPKLGCSLPASGLSD